MTKEEGFMIKFSQGIIHLTEIWDDKEIGVNYIFHCSGSAGGLTPLIDKDEKLVVEDIK